MSGGGAEDRVKDEKSVVGSGSNGCGGDADGGPGGRTNGGGGYGWNGDGDRLSWWEDNLAHVTIGTEPNAPLDYDPGLEHHHPIISNIGEHICRLDRERDSLTPLYVLKEEHDNIIDEEN